MSEQLEILLNITGRIILILLSVVAIKTQIFTFQQLDCNISRLGFFWVYAVGACWSSYELYLLSYCRTFWLAAISQCVCAPHLLCSSSGLLWHHVHASNFALPPHRGAWNSLRAFYLCVSFNFCYLILVRLNNLMEK